MSLLSPVYESPDDGIPRSLLHLANLNWEVCKYRLYADRRYSTDWWATMRKDNKQIIVISGSATERVQNADMFLAISSFGGRVSADQLDEGRRVWFTTQPNDEDEIGKLGSIYTPAMQLSLHRDWKDRFTLRFWLEVSDALAIPVLAVDKHARVQIKLEDLTPSPGCVFAGWTAEFVKTVKDEWKRRTQAMQYRLTEMSSHEITDYEIDDFFVQCFGHGFGEVSTNPRTRMEVRLRNRMQGAYAAYQEYIEKHGKTVLGCVLAYCNWLATRRFKGIDETAKEELRKTSLLFGSDLDRIIHALNAGSKICVKKMSAAAS